MADHPIAECVAKAERLVSTGHCTVYQKYTCGHCGSRQTMETPNTFYLIGCCEDCNHETEIELCNYLLVIHREPRPSNDP